MKASQSFTRYLVAVDSLDTSNYEEEAKKTLKKCKKSSFATIYSRHVKEWKKYFSTCWVDIPDSSISNLYNVSRYVIKANLHP